MEQKKQMSMAEAYYQEILENDPRYLRSLEEKAIKLKEENENMRESLEAIRQWTVAWTWKDEIIAKCFRAAKEGLGCQNQ
jgi:hypothetical protein